MVVIEPDYTNYHITGSNPYHPSQLVVVGADPWGDFLDGYTEAWLTWPGSGSAYTPWHAADVIPPEMGATPTAFDARIHADPQVNDGEAVFTIYLCDPGTYSIRYQLLQTEKTNRSDLTFDDFYHFSSDAAEVFAGPWAWFYWLSGTPSTTVPFTEIATFLESGPRMVLAGRNQAGVVHDFGIKCSYLQLFFTIPDAASVAPPCRGYPRSDALSNSPRRYPPPKSRQYGNRANGYL